MKAPIAVFAFKRAAMLQSTLTQLAANPEAAESDLYVFCDGAKKPEDGEKVSATRDVARSSTGFKSLSVVERTENFGLARSIKTGVTELCARYGRVIVIEDDLDVSVDLLRFMNAALDRYESEDRVMQVAGHMWDVPLDIKEDALFMSFTTSWGWATWQRAWQNYSEDLSTFDTADAAWRKRFDLDGNFPYSKMLERTRNAEIDSWAIYWYYSVFKKAGVSVYPKDSLVAHRGITDQDRTHGHGKVPWSTTVGLFSKNPVWAAPVEPSDKQLQVFQALGAPRSVGVSISQKVLHQLREWVSPRSA